MSAFNGQDRRKELFRDLMALGVCDVILETGTYLGETTRYMAERSGLSVLSCEVNDSLAFTASAALTDTPNAHVYHADSRDFLAAVPAKLTPFVYLDAHWYADLPLVEEVALVTVRFERFVCMIDDFQVPDDPGYGFDDYGPGGTLTLDLLDFPPGVDVFYPSAGSWTETGAKRGCVVLACGIDLSGIEGLRSHEVRSRVSSN